MGTQVIRNTEDNDAVIVELDPPRQATDCSPLTLRQGATSGKGPGIRVSSQNTAAPAVEVTGAGQLMSLRNAASAEVFAVDNAGVVSSANGSTVINVKSSAYGAKGDGRSVIDGAVGSSSATFTSATAAFVSGDVGKLIYVRGAGAAGADLNTTIAGFTNSTTVTLTATASTAVSGATAGWGTDDATAIQGAITVGNLLDYPTIYFPAGTYFIGSALVVAHLMRITGNNALIVATKSGAINFNNTYLHPIPGTFGRSAGLEVDHLEFDVTGGDCFYNCNFNGFTWHDLVLTQRSSNFAAVKYDVTGTNFLAGYFYNIITNVYGTTRTQDAWHLVDHVGGGLASCAWVRCSWGNQNNDASKYFVWMEARGGTNYINGNGFYNCFFDAAYGGCVTAYSSQSINFVNCHIADTNNATPGNSMYHIGTNATGGSSTYTSQGATFVGCGRDLPGPDGSTTYDILLDSSVDLVTIESYECRMRPSDTLKLTYFNLGSATNVVVLNCPTSVITNPGNAIQIPAAGDGNTPSASDGQVVIPAKLAVGRTTTGSAIFEVDSDATHATLFLATTANNSQAVAQWQVAGTTADAINFKVSGDANARLAMNINGRLRWGPATTAADTEAGRSAAGVFYTTKNFLVGGSTALGDNGVGEMQLADATTVPTTNPTGGGLLYSSSGLPYWRDSAGVVHAVSTGTGWQPTDQGFIAWTFDPALSVGTTALSASAGGNLHLVAVPVRIPTTISTVTLQLQASNASLTSGDNFVGLYNAAGTLLSGSADQTSNWNGSISATKAVSLTTPQAVAPGIYWVAILLTGTTGITVQRGEGQSGQMSNIGLSAASFRFAVQASYGTALAAVTMASNSQDTVCAWVGVS